MVSILGRVDRAWQGLAVDLALYAGSALFAAATAVWSTLPAHRVWGTIAAVGYVAAGLMTLAAGLLPAMRRPVARLGVTAGAWAATALLPLLVEAVQRADGRSGRAQEEVVVIELAGVRLLETGSPYLDRGQIAGSADQLLAYVPYQPGMALFGLPRALAGASWWTDARVWFALGTAAALLAALGTAYRGGMRADHLVRAAQIATVLPVCALTLATGGDDLPVLALCLLGIALASRDRWAWAGVAVGAACALKLFAWPVAAVLVFHAATRGRRAARAFAVPAAAVPVAAVAPSILVNVSGVVENLIRFPLGRGLVDSPAASPFPGHLIAVAVPDGRLIAAGLLVAVAIALGIWLLRRPPTTAAGAAGVCALGLLAAILLMPATRFGYLLYPAAFAVWALALPRGGVRADGNRRTQKV